MTIAERLDFLRDKVAEASEYPEPLFIERAKNIESMITFLKKVSGQPYPRRWYFKDKELTKNIYLDNYSNFIKRYKQEQYLYEQKQQELKRFRAELEHLEKKEMSYQFSEEDKYDYKMYIQEQKEMLLEILEGRGSHV